jgi:Ca2+-binding EF-hand superfamily protein
MGNAQARKRIRPADFHYLAKFTAFVSNELVEEYYNKIMEKSRDGRMEKQDFIDTFHIAFPNRPAEKVVKLADEVANKNGQISMANMLVLFYLFCSGKTEDNLTHIFNLFDQDGNKVITIDELLNLMSVFIEIGEGKEHKVDLATVMAEMFQKGDADKNEKLELKEFVDGMLLHPVTSKIIGIKTIDALLEIL